MEDLSTLYSSFLQLKSQCGEIEEENSKLYHLIKEGEEEMAQLQQEVAEEESKVMELINLLAQRQAEKTCLIVKTDAMKSRSLFVNARLRMQKEDIISLENELEGVRWVQAV
jgi:hypothetical protein